MSELYTEVHNAIKGDGTFFFCKISHLNCRLAIDAFRDNLHTMPPFHPRPDLSLLLILGYAFFAFVLGLALTPGFVSFLRRNRLGKQLRVETVDGREASVFRKYHEKKFGTPTMGGVLIWGAIVLTIAFSRLISYFGFAENSLLQRGQVYIPLFTLLSLGVLGAVDDYLNIVGANEEQWNRLLPKIRMWFIGAVCLITVGLATSFWFGSLESLLAIPFVGRPDAGVIGLTVLLMALFAVLLFLGLSGVVVDDVLRRFVIREGKKRGLGVMPKIITLLLLSFAAAGWFYFKNGYDGIVIPFWGEIALGWWYVPFAMFVIIGTANAVNVTDGLDGLAAGLVMIAFGAFGVLSFVNGLTVLAAFCAVTVGAIAAFLWHNVPPALFFMGDTGSLSLGGALAVIALMTDQVVLLPLIGFVFVIEMLSVIIQLTSKKLRGGKKIFRAAPIHHHFEALGWGESKVTMRMWIVGGFCVLLGVIIGMYAG